MRNLSETFFSITEAFEGATIPYAVVGGFAMAFHDVVRATRDIDLLILSTSLAQAEEVLHSLGFNHSGPPFPIGNDPSFMFYRFVAFEGNDHVILDLICSEDPRIGSIVSESIVVDTEMGKVRIARREDLIWLKEQRMSQQDRVDIDRLRGRENDED